MCGIFGLYTRVQITSQTQLNAIQKAFQSIARRGPDESLKCHVIDGMLGFHRLSINDLSSAGMQPITRGCVHVICNGEIFNHRQLIKTYNLEDKIVSKSDCEVIVALYNMFSRDSRDGHGVMERVVKALDGEFAGILVDESHGRWYVFRDEMGVRPLFMGCDSIGNYYFASELKAIGSLCTFANQFNPGHIATFEKGYLTSYARVYPDANSSTVHVNDESFYLMNLRMLLKAAVDKRLMAERPVGALLSGGLDSSLVAALAASLLPKAQLHTFSIGMEGSPDLHFAQIVAKHIQSTHHVVQLDAHAFIHAIDETIHVIESYDITTVRASVGNLLVSRYISENTNIKVLLNGDYSDEVLGGYLYFRNAPSPRAFIDETNFLMDNIHYFDSLRSDRTISSQGLEARTPFADTNFVRFVRSMPTHLRAVSDKVMLRKSFEGSSLLPDSVLWRQKEAFSDGISSDAKPWHTTLAEHFDKIISDEEFERRRTKYSHNPPHTKEALYYRSVFEDTFGERYANVIPYFWMPKWVENKGKDPSARALELYGNNATHKI